MNLSVYVQSWAATKSCSLSTFFFKEFELRKHNMTKDKQCLSLAGEYVVASQLLIRGYHASLTMGNAKTIDILVGSADGSKSVTIQVKTTSMPVDRDGLAKWQLSAKAEKLKSTNLFYAFVHFVSEDERPNIYIVPSAIVADYVERGHRTWLETPGKGGVMRKDTSMRVFDLEPQGPYLQNWKSLGLTGSEELSASMMMDSGGLLR